MYILPVTAKPSKYTFEITKYLPRHFGWDVVKLCGKVFEFPPGTVKYLGYKYLETVIQQKATHAYRNVMAFELKGKRTKDGSETGYYFINNKFARVNINRPQTNSMFSLQCNEVEGICFYGESGVLIKHKVGHTVLNWALVSKRPFIDIETFYKFAITQTNQVGCVFIEGNEVAFSFNVQNFENCTDVKLGCNLTFADGKLFSTVKEYNTIY